MASDSVNHITFTEVDETNHPAATYIYSESPLPTTSQGDASKTSGRIDVMNLSSSISSWSLASLLNLLTDVFLPAGYPHSVSDDYAPYQIFDSLQAFSSSIAGLLSSRAVLQGVGVGNANASPTSALLLHILQDSSGRVATILFAHRVGTALEPECKMYRLTADVFNDVAMVLDCLSPMVPAGVGRVAVLSTASVLRAMCGVAGGSSKASLSAHFSRWGNLAEVNAKDSSQETIISLIGMLVCFVPNCLYALQSLTKMQVGSFVVSRVTSYVATWIVLILLLTLHLALNYAAVRSVQMTSLNKQRANIVFSALFDSDPGFTIDGFDSNYPTEGREKEIEHVQAKWCTLSPAEVAKRERIFEMDGRLKWTSTAFYPPRAHKLGFCRIGISVQEFLISSSSHMSSTSLKTYLPIFRLTSIFKEESYILALHCVNRTWHAGIILKNTSNIETQLKAWAHALLAARVLSIPTSESETQTDTAYIIDVISKTLRFLNENDRCSRYILALAHAGWDVSVGALETRSRRRVICDN
ncbi:RUS1 family protein [Aspergillus tanneri]|uniref:Protein root UVB sensitive/RUS domain-containing protein n=1 Tax=Aspergillus tanneri TaxID=1220188 RepID=A0A5M9MQI1_9EURO|nr:uncharacterized protein ATNIH1004_009045 [Aspergillus tanneri]KAA8644837.1 hypothetical protein ATNIH1004_009045 [Aspergillus tanneri]